MKKTFTDLAELAKRATGPDRELDGLIDATAFNRRVWRTGVTVPVGEADYYERYEGGELDWSLLVECGTPLMRADHPNGEWSRGPNDRPVLKNPNRRRSAGFTSSFDAIMTLAGDDSRRIEHGTYENGTGWAYVYLQNEDGECVGEADANSELLALLAAMLTAKSLRILRDEPIGALHA